MSESKFLVGQKVSFLSGVKRHNGIIVKISISEAFSYRIDIDVDGKIYPVAEDSVQVIRPEFKKGDKAYYFKNGEKQFIDIMKVDSSNYAHYYNDMSHVSNLYPVPEEKPKPYDDIDKAIKFLREQGYEVTKQTIKIIYVVTVYDWIHYGMVNINFKNMAELEKWKNQSYTTSKYQILHYNKYTIKNDSVILVEQSVDGLNYERTRVKI